MAESAELSIFRSDTIMGEQRSDWGEDLGDVIDGIVQDDLLMSSCQELFKPSYREVCRTVVGGFH